MPARTKLLLSVFAVAIIALLIKTVDPIDMYRDRQLRSPITPPVIPQKELDTFKAIARAEAISDPIERCKSTPMPEGINWSSASIDAFCDDVYTPSIWWNELKWMIESGNGRSLDARFDRLISNYFSGDVPEGALRAAYYSNFDGSSALRQRLIEQWQTASPNSPHALAASGLIHIAAAIQYRGDKFISNTPKSQIDAMDREIKWALRELKQALELNPKIMPAYEALIDGARLIGDDDLALQYMQKARVVDPKNYYVLFAYSIMQEPKWSGSTKKLVDISDLAKGMISVNPRMVNLIASIKAYQAFERENRNNQQEQLRILGDAVAEGPHTSTIEQYAKICFSRGDYMKAYEMYSQVLRYAPNDLDALHERARAATQLLAYEYARKDIHAFLRVEPTHLDGLKYDAYLDLLLNDFVSAERKFKFVLTSNPIDDWSIEQVAWIAVFRTQNIKLAREMIDHGFAIAPQNAVFHWLNWELVRRTDRKNLQEVTQDFISHADKSDERQVEALRYTNQP